MPAARRAFLRSEGGRAVEDYSVPPFPNSRLPKRLWATNAMMETAGMELLGAE